MEVLIVVCAILVIILFLPWITYLVGLFTNIIPAYFLVFLAIALVVRYILFVIHRGD